MTNESLREDILKLITNFAFSDVEKDGELADKIMAVFAAKLEEARKEAVEGIEKLRKEHREFECNGANNGKGCYEDWCNMKTCTSKDAIHCKSYNQALDDVLALHPHSKDEKGV